MQTRVVREVTFITPSLNKNSYGGAIKYFFSSQFMRAPYSLILDNFEFLHTSSHSISLTINVPVL
jgi:hypothetical protein